MDQDIGKKKTRQGRVSILNMEVRMAGLALYVRHLHCTWPMLRKDCPWFDVLMTS